MKKFLKFLLFVLLLPIAPMLAATDEEGKGETEKDGEEKPADEKKDETTEDENKTFSQKELDAIIAKRLDRERKTWEEKVESEKKKAAMTEAERLKAERDEAQAKADKAIASANQKLIKSEVIAQATKLNIVDPEAAYTLMDKTNVSIDEEDNVLGVDSSLKSLIETKKYLIGSTKAQKTGDNTGEQKGNTGATFNDLIRRAAGRQP